MAQASPQRTQQYRKLEKAQEILEKHGSKRSELIGILQDLQAEYRYLPEEVLTYVATAVGIPPARVYGVATFYAQFSLEPKGRIIIRLCDGTACHVRGSEEIEKAVRGKLGLAPGRNTTEDMQFTVEKVSCLGACGLAPVMVVIGDGVGEGREGKVYGQLTPERASEIVEKLMREVKGDVRAA